MLRIAGRRLNEAVRDRIPSEAVASLPHRSTRSHVLFPPEMTVEPHKKNASLVSGQSPDGKSFAEQTYRGASHNPSDWWFIVLGFCQFVLPTAIAVPAVCLFPFGFIPPQTLIRFPDPWFRLRLDETRNHLLDVHVVCTVQNL